MLSAPLTYLDFAEADIYTRTDIGQSPQACLSKPCGETLSFKTFAREMQGDGPRYNRIQSQYA